jgi:lipid-A-disaccharide synthase
MARLLRKMLVTFPFEKPIYDAAGLDCSNVGNPLVDAIPAPLLHKGSGDAAPSRQIRLRKALGWKDKGPFVGLLPGSREQEVRWLLPVMLETAKRLFAQDPGRRFVVVKPPAAPMGWYEPALAAQAEGLPLQIFAGKSQAQAYEARAAMDFALVASGTATLETALLGTPFCILYRVHPLTYAIGKRLVKIHSIGLANVVAGKRVVPEFLQHELDPDAIAVQSERLLTRPSERRVQRAGLAKGLAGLGKPGVSKRVAAELLALAKEGRA